MSGEGVQFHGLRHQRLESVEALAHVAGAGAEVNPHARRQVGHGCSRSTVSTVRRVAASTPQGMRRRQPALSSSSSGATGLRSDPVGGHQSETYWRLVAQPLPPGIERLLGQASLCTEGAYRLAAHSLLLNHTTPVFAARNGFVRTAGFFHAPNIRLFRQR